MTRAERRLRDFSSGMMNLGADSRNYIHQLTHILFLVEKPPVCPVPNDDFIRKPQEYSCRDNLRRRKK